MYDSYDPAAICFLNLRECIAKAKQDWNYLIGMENDVKEAVEYVDAVNSFESIDMKNYHELKYSRFDDLFSKFETIKLTLDFITYDEQGIPIIVDKATANESGASTFTTNPFDAALNSGNNNNNNNNNTHTSLNNFEIAYQSESDSDISSKQEAFLNNNTNNRQRPSTNTALKTDDNAKDLGNEIEQKLRKEKSFKHARNRSTQIAEQVSGHSDIYVKKSSLTSLGEQSMDQKIDDEQFLNENESTIMSGIHSQHMLTKHHNSKISRTFSNEDVNKIENRTGNNNNNRSRDTDSDNDNELDDRDVVINKTQGSQIIRDIGIEQLAQITGAHEREASLQKAKINVFNNDANVAPLANMLAGFFAGPTEPEPKPKKGKLTRLFSAQEIQGTTILILCLTLHLILMDWSYSVIRARYVGTLQ